MSGGAAYKNQAHRAAFANGRRACAEGKDRYAPYSADSNQSRYFRRAWLTGYDSEAPVSARDALSACVDAMRRSDPDSGQPLCTDQEWDAALAAGTTVLAHVGGAA